MRHLLWLWLLLALVLLLAAVAYTPLDIRIGMGADGGRWRMRVKVAPPWGFPRVAMRSGWHALVPTPRKGSPRRSGPAAADDAGTKEAAPSPSGGGEKGRSSRSRRRDPSIEERWRAGNRLWTWIHVDRAHVRVIAGLGDAASTAVACGLLWAVLSTIVGALPDLAADRARVRVHPSYGEARFEASLALTAHLAVWQAALVALALFWPPG